jgi:hypothetical protein
MLKKMNSKFSLSYNKRFEEFVIKGETFTVTLTKQLLLDMLDKEEDMQTFVLERQDRCGVWISKQVGDNVTVGSFYHPNGDGFDFEKALSQLKEGYRICLRMKKPE